MKYSLDIKVTNAQVNISNNFRRFKIKRNPPTMSIQRKTPEFDVNWDKVRAESGLKSPKFFMDSITQKSQNNIINGINRIAEEGDMMTRIENDAPENMIAVIATQNSRAAIPDFNMSTMPENLAEITWDDGVFEINWSKGSLEVIWDEEYMPDVSVTPYSVEINIRNMGGFKALDRAEKMEGRKVDRKI